PDAVYALPCGQPIEGTDAARSTVESCKPLRRGKRGIVAKPFCSVEDGRAVGPKVIHQYRTGTGAIPGHFRDIGLGRSIRRGVIRVPIAGRGEIRLVDVAE